jgi:hypothetical protein
MLDMKSDFFYSLYAHIRGWCVRLNKKMVEAESTEPISTFITSVGSGLPNDHLIQLLQKYEQQVKTYSNSAPTRTL